MRIKDKHTRKFRFSLSRLYRLVAFLFLLAIGSSVLASLPLAKYASTGNEYSDTGRVARFAVLGLGINGVAPGGELDSFFLNPGSQKESFEFSVINADAGEDEESIVYGEVSTNYDVILTFPEKIAGVGVELILETIGNETESVEKNTTIPASISDDGLTYTFSNCGTFAPSEYCVHDYILYFSFLEEEAKAGVWENIKVEINYKQVD